MAIEVFTTGSEDYGQHMKVLVCGHAGAGKTLFSSTFPNTFFASAEGGLMSVARRRVRGTNIRSSADLREVKQALDQPANVRAELLGGPVDTIVIDTIDEIQRLLHKERLEAKRLESFDQASWGWLGEQMRAILRGFRNLEMNVVFTCHLKESTDQSTGQVFFKPALQGAVGDEVSQYMDLALLLRTELATRINTQTNSTERYEKRFLQTYKDSQHDWIKDRSGQLPGEVEVNFEDDYERLNTAIFGFVSEWTEQRVTQSLEQIVEATGPSDSEVLAAAAKAAPTPNEVVEPEPEPEPEPEAEASTTPEPSTDTVPEPEPEAAEEEAPSPEPKPDPEAGEKYTCSECGGEFDSLDQKELSEIMIRRIACRPCYSTITKKK